MLASSDNGVFQIAVWQRKESTAFVLFTEPCAQAGMSQEEARKLSAKHTNVLMYLVTSKTQLDGNRKCF